MHYQRLDHSHINGSIFRKAKGKIPQKKKVDEERRVRHISAIHYIALSLFETQTIQNLHYEVVCR